MDNPYENPLYLIYWIALKSKYKSLKEWHDKMLEQEWWDEDGNPVKIVLEFLEKYGTEI